MSILAKDKFSYFYFSVTSKKPQSLTMAAVASKKAQKAEDFAISQSLLDYDEPDALRPGTCSSHFFTNPHTPARIHFIRGLKSWALKLPFLARVSKITIAILEFKKKSKWPPKKKAIFQLRQFSIFFCENLMDIQGPIPEIFMKKILRTGEALKMTFV